MKNSLLLFISLLWAGLGSCSHGKAGEEATIDFGPLRQANEAELLYDIRLISLQTDSDCLIGSVDQIEWFDDQLYILDANRERSIYRFDAAGRYIDKIVPGEGNGRFLMPFSFQIDSAGGRLIVKDITQNHLLAYDLRTLEFANKIEADVPSVSFGLLPSSEGIVYYHLAKTDETPHPFSLRDTAGHTIGNFLTHPAYPPIFHGKRCVFYTYRGQLHGFPYFENKIYTLASDSMRLKYVLAFGPFEWPDNEFFRKFQHNTKVVGAELLHSGKIRMMEPYETDETLLVKYYIGKDIYLGAYDKAARRTINLRAAEIKDDFGIGSFPDPKGVYGPYFIAVIPRDNLSVLREKAAGEWAAMLEQSKEGDNPIVCLYRFRLPAD